MEKLNLDVGCGKAPLKGATIHIDCKRESFHIEIVCDAEHLPFRGGIFYCTHCSHVIEHCLAPLEVLKELKRVSSKWVVIKVPNASHYREGIGETNEHLYSWNQKTLGVFLRKVFNSVEIRSGLRFAGSLEEIRKKASVKSALSTLYVLLSSFLFGTNELVGICEV